MLEEIDRMAREGAAEQLAALLDCAHERDSDEKTPGTEPSSVAVGIPRVGQCVGRYKLIEQIGEGGCGTVFLAEQKEPVVRQVALKVIKVGMDTRQTLARFETERQALAIMDHPNIAKFLDAGQTETGRPYFVMELIRGVPITTYCDQHRLSIRGRLRLFVQVCQALQHAHAKGIIHRDIKPTNVLVNAQDDVATPKIIDFGVAKALDDRLTDRTLLTQPGQMLGTLQYMSPEQADVGPADIDLRSDVYSLGVLLFELLTGTTPFEASRFRAAGHLEAARILQQERPPRPSDRIAAMDAQSATVAAEQRQSDVGRLSRRLRGYLDRIVLRCLEADRSRRYQTVDSLQQDVQLDLNDESELAGNDQIHAMVRKGVKRALLRHGAVTVAIIAALNVAAFFALSHLAKTAALSTATTNAKESGGSQITYERQDPTKKTGSRIDLGQWRTWEVKTSWDPYAQSKGRWQILGRSAEVIVDIRPKDWDQRILRSYHHLLVNLPPNLMPDATTKPSIEGILAPVRYAVVGDVAFGFGTNGVLHGHASLFIGGFPHVMYPNDIQWKQTDFYATQNVLRPTWDTATPFGRTTYVGTGGVSPDTFTDFFGPSGAAHAWIEIHANIPLRDEKGGHFTPPA